MSLEAPTREAPLDTQHTEVGALPFDWSVVPLISLAEKIMVGIASAATHAYRSAGVTMFRNQNIRPGVLDVQDVLYIDSQYEQTYKNKRLKAGDLLTARTGYPGTTSLVPEGFDGSQSFTTLITRPRSGSVDPRYLCLYINGRSGQKYFEQAQIGGGQKNVNAASLKLLPVAVPNKGEEQRAIADALTDADALIDSLEQLLTKKRQIKQGAMQQLLAGKRRLPGFGSAAVTRSEALPSDWVRVAIGDIAEVKTGPFGSALHERDYVRSGTPIITVEHLAERGIQGDGAPQVGEKDVTRLQGYRLEEGDIVFSRVGSIDRNARVSSDEEGWLFSGRLLRLRLKTTNIDSRFLSYLFHGEPFRRQVERVAVGQTMASLNTKLLSGLEVVVPTVDEQRAIANALFAMDAEIESLESRLTKARALKQAMAQGLLTGRIRLVEPTA